jgi:hypothetical protein
MTDTLKKLVVDIAKGTQEYIDLTPEEIAQREADAAAFVVAEADQLAADAAAAEAKANGIAKLLALGLTEEEAQALTK